VARDISELIKANIELKEAKEIAERSLKVKERFLANMSHEIRTPMNGLVGMIDLLGTTELNSKQADYIKTLKLSSDNLLNILNDILDLSKIEAGKMELRKEPVNIIETIESIYDLYSQQAYSNDIELYYNLDDRLPDRIITDRTRLIQIIANLTSNAIKFSDKKGPVNISVRLLSIDKKHYVIKVSVKDSGIGISPKDQQSLFKSFSQIDSSNKKSYAGTGLGLAISKELVKLMGGEISIVSTPGLGSTFSFTFLSEIPDKSLMDDNEKNTRNTYQKFENQKPKILLVDDNDINRKVANEILKQAGCTIDLAKSGYEAIEKVKKEKYDLIFMDIQMPELDGIETTHKLKAIINDDLAPVIAMTAYSMEEDRKKFLNEGLDDYISKPIKSDIIIGKVKEWTKFEPEIKTSAVSTVTDHKDLIINQNTLNQLYKYGGSELINSVLLDFEKEATALIEISSDSMDESDFENVRSCMHTLKGNAGTLGIERVSKYAKNVENTLKQNKFEKLQHEMKKLKQSFEEFKKSYKNLINN